MIACLFDTETTGLIENRSIAIDKQPSVIEFYGCTVDLNTGDKLDEFELLIKPPQPISAEITRITTIDNDLVADAKPFAFHAEGIKNYLEGRELCIAHNASYDKEVLDIEYERLGNSMKCLWPRTLCTVEATIHLKGYRLTLSALHQLLFDEPFTGAHRARVDVNAMTRCCVELFKRGEL